MHFQCSVLFMGSFNGIILIRLGVQLCLWNPSIGMSHTFSDPFPDPSCQIIYGLGYDFVTDDFKVVGAVWSRNGPSSVHVFASKLGSWKRIGDFGYRIYHGRTGTVLNGMPHWVVCHDTDRNSLLSTLIVCFDASEDKFMEVPRPNYGVDDDHFDLGVLGEFYIHNLKKLCFTKDGDVVIALNSRKLVVYNPKRNSYKRIRIPKDCNQFDSAFSMESLASPQECNGTRAPLISLKLACEYFFVGACSFSTV
ncbi:hypothetical protein Vadar_004455 [Vaccinium darrowii]|uniref:Uncharacterized protein n=1 Tax=Vaccinium darrowii TaxID=229202 RepID=A0ACB7XNH7_9ERIC|nr:hypothetical protein Vadar_004455 [Vaccinium darrowii]